MAPSTRSKRTLAEADPNAEINPKRAPKGSKNGRRPWVIMKKGETMQDVMGPSAEKARENENESLDHCASCGKEIDEAGNKVGEEGDKGGGKGRAKSKAKTKSRVKATAEVATGIGSQKPAKESKE
ncbi:hypothetical protein MMC27_003960 [Xylographa pallens]|nr:hypothetical protein [Xylographa pallens]